MSSSSSSSSGSKRGSSDGLGDKREVDGGGSATEGAVRPGDGADGFSGAPESSSAHIRGDRDVGRGGGERIFPPAGTTGEASLPLPPPHRRRGSTPSSIIRDQQNPAGQTPSGSKRGTGGDSSGVGGGVGGGGGGDGVGGGGGQSGGASIEKGVPSDSGTHSTAQDADGCGFLPDESTQAAAVAPPGSSNPLDASAGSARTVRGYGGGVLLGGGAEVPSWGEPEDSADPFDLIMR
jgi:hypothetical protein